MDGLWLIGERVRLRALEPEDLEPLYLWENDSALWERGNTLAPFSRYILREYIASGGGDLYESRQLRLMVEERETGLPVGLIDLFDFEPRHSRAECGILIDRRWQGRGLATDALRALVRYASGFLRLHQLYAYIPLSNVPCRRLFARCGFEEAGILRDWIRMPGGGYSDVVISQAVSGD